MSDWRKLYDARDWRSLEHWWRYEASDEEACALWDALCADIPKVEHRNGMERRLVTLPAQLAPKEWKGAAEILEQGELASRVFEAGIRKERDQAGSPSEVTKDASILWGRTRKRILSDIDGMERAHADLVEEARRKGRDSSPEARSGDPVPSPLPHISTTREALAELALLSAAARAAMGSDLAEQDWMTETLAEATELAFMVGYYHHAAQGKFDETTACGARKSWRRHDAAATCRRPRPSPSARP